jgi:hypothetical protein
MKQTIGLMMVVRNEVKVIRDCLNFYTPYVDEIAICDQTSRDGTYKILQEYKPNVPYRLWRDNPRGYCEPSKQITADLMKSDWILYVDPDERFPKEFLKQMHNIVENTSMNGFNFPRDNFFEVQVFDDNVPIEPKWMIIKHPANDDQRRLTRRSVSVFPPHLHHRVRITGEAETLPYRIRHIKTLTEQWQDNKRYSIVNKK